MKTLFSSNSMFAEEIFLFYQQNKSQLHEKEFHFMTRLYLWSNGKMCGNEIKKFQKSFLRKGFLQEPYTIKEEILKKFTPERKNKLEQFLELLKYHDILLQTLYARTLYEKDYTASAKDLLPESLITSFERNLFKDQRAVATLSTFAVTFIYLVHRILWTNLPFDVPSLLSIAQKHLDPTKPDELSMLIYFYTHCIIGESLFYSREIPSDLLPVYKDVIQTLEHIFMENYTNTSLDHKFEFLVCCRICHYQTKVETRIMDETTHSLSPDGFFLIDSKNYYAGKKDTSVYGAEHQNVLYLLTTIPWQKL